jgi:hypothetical protein
LSKFQSDSKENKPNGESEALDTSLVEIREPGHQYKIGEGVRELVSFLDWQLDGGRGQGKGGDEQNKAPTENKPKAPRLKLNPQKPMPSYHCCLYGLTNAKNAKLWDW